MAKKIAVLGCTGSIGTQTLQVVDEFSEEYQVEILAGHSNWQLVYEQCQKYSPKYVILTDNGAYQQLQSVWKNTETKLLYGTEGINIALEECSIDMVVGAIGGAAGIEPTLRALELGIDVALANKETIVAAGDLVRKVQEQTGAKILPVDSEHSAIMQCIGHEQKAINKILLTASGGPFFRSSTEELKQVTKKEALKHPNWSMGRKITIDSATLMNKGLEVIEANWLFNVSYDDIQVVVHPQSIVHSMVEYGDGSILAHLGMADMRIPIQYALTYPERRFNSYPKLDLMKVASLEFLPPDMEKFPCLALAYEAGRIGMTMPAVLNATNEVAVDAFLQDRISFMGIADLVKEVMEKHSPTVVENLTHLREIDEWARKMAREIIEKK